MEAVVAPSDRKSLSQSDDEVFLAATEFELFDSSLHFGFCFPADDSGVDYLQPVIVSGVRHVNFWFDGPVSPAALASQWSALGKQPHEVFPVAFRCLVPVDGRTVRGRIPGVEFYEERPPAAGARAIARIEGSEDRVLTARPLDARRPGASATDRRTARRRPAEMAVEFVQDGAYGTGVTGNLSRRGLFVRSSQIPGTGPAVHLTVKLPNGRRLDLTGRVVRTVADAARRAAPSGFGVRLTGDSSEYDDLFSRLRDRHK